MISPFYLEKKKYVFYWTSTRLVGRGGGELPEVNTSEWHRTPLTKEQILEKRRLGFRQGWHLIDIEVIEYK